MRLFYVYILLCSDNTFYVGVTNDITRRMSEHENGINETSYTRDRRPLKLVYQELYFDPLEAIRREKQIKKWSQAKKNALINGDWKRLSFLSKKKK